MAYPGDPAVESPVWWCHRLYEKLIDRQPELERYDAYYRGDHPLPWLPEQVQDMARRILQMTRTNYMGLVVDATTEREEVLGFRVEKDEDVPPPFDPNKDQDDEGADEECTRIWQANNLDATSSEAFLEAAKLGTVYWMVGPNPDDSTTPKVTIEHASQMIVEYSPSNLRQRDAALKVWYDDRTKLTNAILILPKWVYKYQGPKDSKPDKWVPRAVAGERWPAKNPLNVVSVVEMRNNPQTVYRNGQLDYVGVSELVDVVDVQDRINKTIADRLITQDFGAFPQKWASNWAEDDDDDETSVQAQAAADAGMGRTLHPAGKVNFGRDRLVVATGDVKFGQWSSAPLDPYSAAKNEDVKDIAARTRTPSQYLLGEMINISGEALQSAESGLVSKVKLRLRYNGEALEEVVRLFLKASGDNRPLNKGTSTIWRDPQFRTVGQMADAVIKKHLAGLISWDQAMEDLGYTPIQISRNRRQKRQDTLEGAALNFDGLFNAPKLGKATDNNIRQKGPEGAPVKPGDTTGVNAPPDLSSEFPNAPTPGANTSDPAQ